MANIIGVRFKKPGKIYFFDPEGIEIKKGQYVIVETAMGVEYGEVAIANRIIPDEKLEKPLKKIIRVATYKDKKQNEENKKKEQEALKICQKKIEEHKLDMTLTDVEYKFDRSKLLFFFTAEGRIDFRDLVKDLAAIFKTRIELRQIGVRDEVKKLGRKWNVRKRIMLLFISRKF
jgi:cell fate regulator YaaT (PSP1 superfamily)